MKRNETDGPYLPCIVMEVTCYRLGEDMEVHVALVGSGGKLGWTTYLYIPRPQDAAMLTAHRGALVDIPEEGLVPYQGVYLSLGANRQSAPSIEMCQ